MPCTASSTNRAGQPWDKPGNDGAGVVVVARMSEATSGVCLSNYNPACRYAYAGYLLLA